MPTRIDLTGGPGLPRITLADGEIAARLLPPVAGSHRVALVATQALLLAGDRVRVEVRVDGPHRLELVETGGTVAYNMRGETAAWEVHIVLRDGARLTWSGEPFVVATGAEVVRSTVADVDAGCRLSLRERLVLGRTGEDGGHLRSRTRIDLAGLPAVAEDLVLTPESRDSPAVLGGNRCLDTLTVVGHRLPDRPGVLQAEAEASVARWLGTDLHRSDLR